MKDTLRAGLEGTFRYRIPESKTVPRIAVRASDGADLVSEGTHERHVIDARRFEEKVAAKRARVQAAA
jgi:hypothetical protein